MKLRLTNVQHICPTFEGQAMIEINGWSCLVELISIMMRCVHVPLMRSPLISIDLKNDNLLKCSRNVVHVQGEDMKSP